jgi:hypothetical protein
MGEVIADWMSTEVYHHVFIPSCQLRKDNKGAEVRGNAADLLIEEPPGSSPA